MRHIHFIGIGGIGMSGIAKVLLEMGYTVTGSDIKPSRMAKKLELMGAKCSIGHQAGNVGNADAIVISSAIPEHNPEIQEARRRDIRIMQRAEMLGYLMSCRMGIAVAGTHGKTTTTSMIAAVMEHNALNPTVVIGGELNDIGSNAKLGRDTYLLAEADESDASFLHLIPRIAVITNIDSDVNLNVMPYAACNFNYDRTMEVVKENFRHFAAGVPDEGKVVLCIDNELVRTFLAPRVRRKITYGFHPDADIQARDMELVRFSSRAEVYYRGKLMGTLVLKVPGRHNIQNALAAIAVGMELGLSFDAISSALYAFEGVQRRFQILGESAGVLVVDDYAHNPQKIMAALHAARTGARNRVVAVFQPHRYSRTRFLLDEFAGAFHDADEIIVTDIYPAGEEPIVGIKGEIVADRIREKVRNARVIHIPRIDDLVPYLLDITREGDIVITLGAGDICKVAEKLH